MPATLLKSDSNIGEFCKTFKNNYFVKHMQTDDFLDSLNTFDVIRFYHILAV